jgi:hypothetical protein
MRSRYMLASLLGAGFALVLSLPSPADETPSKEKIEKLIEQMGNGTFAEREKATKELSAIGVPALEALRKATKSEDAEVRKRAEDLLPKIERQAESIRILAPKRVHLVYKDTPLSEAVADFQTKSGYTFHLHDPEGKLKERKLTLDTGATTFWHALGMFCDKAELTEGTMQDLMQAPQAPAGGAVPPPGAPAMKPAILRPGRVGGGPMMPAMPSAMGQIILKDGKSKSLPSDDGSAVRVRALGKSEMFGTPGEGEVILALEVSPEPKLQWQALQSIRLDTAEDDRDQKLTQVIPQVVGPGGIGVGGFGIGGGPGIARPMIAGPGFPMPGMMWGGISQQVPLQLKKGAKEAKSLKELKGVITAQLLTEPQPMIVADKLKVGETFKGKEGGFIKIVAVKAEDEKTTIQLEFEQPPFEKVVPAQLNGIPGFVGGGAMPMQIRRIVPARKVAPAPAAPPAGLAAPPPPAAPPPVQVAPVQAQIVIQGGNFAIGGNIPLNDSFNGLTIQNDKDKVLPIQMGQTHGRFQQMPGGGFVQNMTYTLICPHDKDKGKPAKVVFLGRKRATVDIPFALKDVALPK